MRRVQICWVLTTTFLNIHVQGWTSYVATLGGPIYPNIMKAFWKYVFVISDNSCIQSSIFGFPLIITSSSISEVIGCAQTGVTTEQSCLVYTPAEKLMTIHDTTSGYEPTSP